MKKQSRKQSHENIHTLAANALKHQDADSETDDTETEYESTKENVDEDEVTNAEDIGKEGSKTKGDAYKKVIYKALDGSALMGIGAYTSFDTASCSTHRRYCAPGVCGTYSFVQTFYGGARKGEAEKNRVDVP